MVILKRIEIENFRRIKSLSLEFPEGVMIIKGPNEAGKSTILEAVLYALFGETMRGLKDLAINHNSDRASIKLTFSVNGKEFNVTRLLRRKSSSEGRLFELQGGRRIPRASTFKSTNEVVRNILGGLSFNEILVTNVVAQKELDKIVELKGSEREKIINSLLGLESYNKAIDKLSQERRERKRDLEYSEKMATELARRVEEYRRDVKSIKEKTKELGASRELLKARLEELREIEPVYKLLSEYRDGVLRRKRLEERIKGLEKLLGRLKEEIRESRELMNRTKTRIKEAETELATLLRELRERERDLADKEAVLDRLRREFERVSSLMEEKRKLDSLIRENEEEVRRAELRLSELVNEMSVKEAEDLLRLEKEIKERIALTKPSFKVMFALLATSIFGLLAPPLALTGILGSGAYLIYVYLRKVRLKEKLLLIMDDVNKAREHLYIIKETKERLSKLKERYAKMRDEAEKLSAELAKVLLFMSESLKVSLKGILEDDYHRVKEGFESFIKIRDELRSKVGLLKERIASVERERAKLGEELRRLESKMRSLDEEVRNREGELEAVREEYLKVKLPQLPPQIEYSDRIYEEYEARFHALKEEVGRITGAIKQLEVTVKELEERIEANRDVEEKYREAKSNMERLSKEVEALTKAIECLKMVASKIRESFRPAIERNMSLVISHITDGRYKAVKLDEKYNIYVLDSEAGEFRPKDIYSGGTVDQFLLAMRLAFILSLLPQTKQTYPRFLFLDEPLASSDQRRRQNIIKLLTTTLSEHFKQIILITHLDINPPNSKTIVLEDGKVKM